MLQRLFSLFQGSKNQLWGVKKPPFLQCENKPPLDPKHASPHLRLVFFEGVFSVEYPKLPTDIGLYWNWREMMEVKGPKEKKKIQNLKRTLFCNFFSRNL